jgi:hypothetical protein
MGTASNQTEGQVSSTPVKVRISGAKYTLVPTTPAIVNLLLSIRPADDVLMLLMYRHMFETTPIMSASSGAR